MNKSFCLATILALSSTMSAIAGWPTDGQLNKVPAAANAVLAMDVSGAYGSALGVKEGWSKRYSETQHAGLGSLPPNVESMLVAAQFDLNTLDPVWQLGIAKTSATLDGVAKSEGGVVTQVAGQAAVESPRGAYFASAGDWQIGVYAPADRQAFARWLRGPASKGNGGISAYLKKAVESRGNAQAVVATDLTDTVDAMTARLYMAHLPTAVKNNLDPVAMASLFKGIQGFTLRVNITDRVTGQLQVDFSDSIGPLAPFLPGLVQNVLEEWGATINDFKGWTPRFTPTAMVLEGPLSNIAMRNIISLFELPGGAGQPQASPGAPGQPNTGDVTSTLRYFKSVNDILTELRRMKSDLQDEKAYDKFALWYENYAKKIDYLPTLGVDPECAAFGAQTAATLRGISGSLRGVPLKTKEAGAGAYYYYTGFAQRTGRRSTASGITSIDTNVSQVMQQQQKIVADDSQARTDAWKSIDDSMASLRQKMSERYKLVF